MSQIMETPAIMESEIEKSELHQRFDRASVHHAAMHREESLRNFAEFRKRKEAEQAAK